MVNPRAADRRLKTGIDSSVCGAVKASSLRIISIFATWPLSRQRRPRERQVVDAHEVDGGANCHHNKKLSCLRGENVSVFNFPRAGMPTDPVTRACMAFPGLPSFACCHHFVRDRASCMQQRRLTVQLCGVCGSLGKRLRGLSGQECRPVNPITVIAKLGRDPSEHSLSPNSQQEPASVCLSTANVL